MLRTQFLIILALASASAAPAGVWPDHLGHFDLRAAQPAQAAGDAAVWKEYGLETAAEADYNGFHAVAYRFKDSTGAVAGLELLAGTAPGKVFRQNNYVIDCLSGDCASAQKALATATLPDMQGGAAPILAAYLPRQGLLPRSERYVLGPVSLNAFAPDVPQGAAGFEFGAEGQAAEYNVRGTKQRLVLFSYPTPSIARQQAAAFEKASGVAVKRTGPLVGVVAAPASAEAAEALLSRITYHAAVNFDQQPPPNVTVQSVGKMILAIFELAGLLIVVCIGGGILMAWLRIRRRGRKNAVDSMTVLHLADR